jgi:hypothetical protein
VLLTLGVGGTATPVALGVLGVGDKAGAPDGGADGAAGAGAAAGGAAVCANASPTLTLMTNALRRQIRTVSSLSGNVVIDEPEAAIEVPCSLRLPRCSQTRSKIAIAHSLHKRSSILELSRRTNSSQHLPLQTGTNCAQPRLRYAGREATPNQQAYDMHRLRQAARSPLQLPVGGHVCDPAANRFYSRHRAIVTTFENGQRTADVITQKLRA